MLHNRWQILLISSLESLNLGFNFTYEIKPIPFVALEVNNQTFIPQTPSNVSVTLDDVNPIELTTG
ncbi:hypothetical protein Bpfe_024976, partial [Biomphalaria pfeifferi]